MRCKLTTQPRIVHSFILISLVHSSEGDWLREISRLCRIHRIIGLRFGNSHPSDHWVAVWQFASSTKTSNKQRRKLTSFTFVGQHAHGRFGRLFVIALCRDSGPFAYKMRRNVSQTLRPEICMHTTIESSLLVGFSVGAGVGLSVGL